MKLIILAAGQGKRLRPLTNNKPKCLIEYKNKPILQYILESAKECKIDDLAIVTGYKKEVLTNYLQQEKITFFTNDNYSNTNMVTTLFCAKEFMNEDIIISYSDIVYDSNVLCKLKEAQEGFCVVVDKKWKDLWLQRMSNPLEDAETLKIKDNKIIQLGQKPDSYDDIEGQYIGLIKISKNIISDIIAYYNKLDDIHQNIFMTSFIQMLINDNFAVTPVFINGGWLEIDCISDLETTIIR